MKPEPPIGSAIPNASPAPASGTICSQEPPTWACRLATTTTPAAATPGHSGQDPVADLLEHQPNRTPVADCSRLGLRDRQHDPEHRHADPVIQAALDVQALSNSAREPHQRDDSLAEGCVGRRENHRKQQRLGPQSSGNTTRARTETGHERQRQADPEQTGRNRELPA